MRKQGKTRIVLTFNCKDCDTRYDMMWDNVKTQEFKGCCTKCAHKRSQDYRRLQAKDLINKFEQYGYKVITPIEKIKPRGKNKTLNQTKVLVEDKFGYRFEINYNNFCNRIDRYIELNNDNNNFYAGKHIYEEKVCQYLEELQIPYKREFVFQDCRGKDNRQMRFDFCLYFNQPEKHLLIEIDERHHTNTKVKKRDRIKNYYCEKNNIPLLRIDYRDIRDLDNFKKQIDNFLLQNKK